MLRLRSDTARIDPLRGRLDAGLRLNPFWPGWTPVLSTSVTPAFGGGLCPRPQADGSPGPARLAARAPRVSGCARNLGAVVPLAALRLTVQPRQPSLPPWFSGLVLLPQDGFATLSNRLAIASLLAPETRGARAAPRLRRAGASPPNRLPGRGRPSERLGAQRRLAPPRLVAIRLGPDVPQGGRGWTPCPRPIGRLPRPLRPFAERWLRPHFALRLVAPLHAAGCGWTPCPRPAGQAPSLAALWRLEGRGARRASVFFSLCCRRFVYQPVIE